MVMTSPNTMMELQTITAVCNNSTVPNCSHAGNRSTPHTCSSTAHTTSWALLPFVLGPSWVELGLVVSKLSMM